MNSALQYKPLFMCVCLFLQCVWGFWGGFILTGAQTHRIVPRAGGGGSDQSLCWDYWERESTCKSIKTSTVWFLFFFGCWPIFKNIEIIWNILNCNSNFLPFHLSVITWEPPMMLQPKWQVRWVAPSVHMFLSTKSARDFSAGTARSASSDTVGRVHV